MMDVIERLRLMGIVPVVRIDDPETAVPLAKALIDGGLPCAEITFRTAQAEESIIRICKEFPDMLVGAGTVLTCEQVDRAVAAGAKFIVTPGLNPKVVKHCLEKNIPVTPGCSNPSDIEQALEFGIDVVKFFPAEASGGIEAIKAMAAPYVNVRFMPTGGINIKNLNDYLKFPKIIACGGSWMVKPELMADGNFEEITRLTKEAIHTMLGFELKHVGINAENASESEGIAKQICSIFGFDYKAGNSSNFSGTSMEVMKAPYLGKNGHIAIGTNNVERAVAYLKSQGVSFLDNTARISAGGELNAIYLKEEIGGFAFHLAKK